jgi:hypothetical protein
MPRPDPSSRQHSPAAERNRGAILAELMRLWPAQGFALEIASGTGQHAAHFAAALPGWHWQPSEGDARALTSIAAWCGGLANVLPPLLLDVRQQPWAGVPATVDAIFAANLLHIAPWEVSIALMRGAARHLAPHGVLTIYGAFFVDGEPVAPSNLAFDADLRARDAAWGVRRLAEVQRVAHEAGLALRERIALPANNLLLHFTREQTSPRQPTTAEERR